MRTRLRTGKLWRRNAGVVAWHAFGPLRLAVGLALLLIICGAGPILADDCSGPSDCQAPPGNADAATGIAAGIAVLAIVLATAARRRQQGGSRAPKREGRSTPGTQQTRASGYDAQASADRALGGSQGWRGRDVPAAEVSAERWAAVRDAAGSPDSQRLPTAPPGPPAAPGSAGGQLGGSQGHPGASSHDMQRVSTPPPAGAPVQPGSDGGQLGGSQGHGGASGPAAGSPEGHRVAGHDVASGPPRDSPRVQPGGSAAPSGSDGGQLGGSQGHGAGGGHDLQRLGTPPPAGAPAHPASDGGQLGGSQGHGAGGGDDLQRLGTPPPAAAPDQPGSAGGQLGGSHGEPGLARPDHGSAPGPPPTDHDVAGGWHREGLGPQPGATPEHHLTPDHEPQDSEKREGTRRPDHEPPRPPASAPSEQPPSERPTEGGALGGQAGGGHGHDIDADADFPVSERPTDPRGQPGLGHDQTLGRPPRPHQEPPHRPDERP